ncbi:hypothetical protein PAL_GLEAN10020925 [Pteropus alecto]|uniref:Uncharacterized protein n=1 Tax=Pteropus alecto TaxID=9402 RepID=L5JSQ9_PTEAL|nr:hypothetical protein PAL_GLEAN10020925 [Pteropus alecto]
MQRCDIWNCCSHFSYTGHRSEVWPLQLEAEVRKPQNTGPSAIVGPRSSQAPRQSWSWADEAQNSIRTQELTGTKAELERVGQMKPRIPSGLVKSSTRH